MTAARMTALLLGILALAALRARHDMLPSAIAGQDILARLWYLSGHYATATGLLAAVAFLAVARGWRIGPRAAAALVVALALSALITPSIPLPPGPVWQTPGLSVTGLVLILPGAALLWWLAFAPKVLTTGDLAWLLAWPLAYLAQALLRGALGAGSPDPALTPPWLGAALVFMGLALALALALLGLARLLRR